MKHLKLYENMKPEVGDWVIDSVDDIGEIDKIVEEGYYIYFNMRNVRERLYVHKDPTSENDAYIVHFGTKEEMEMIMQTRKYNI